MTKEQEFRKQTEEAKFEAFSVMCKKVTKLEKENAKLKTDYEVLSCSVGDFEELQNKLEEEQRKNNGLSDNLTKAKELLRDLIRFQPYIDKEAIFLSIGNEWKIAICKAEQFLEKVSE